MKLWLLIFESFLLATIAACNGWIIQAPLPCPPNVLSERPAVIAFLDRYIELHPKSYSAYLARAKEYLLSECFRQSLKDCDQAIEIEPGAASAHRYRARCLEAIGNRETALSELTVLIDGGKGSEQDWTARSLIYSAQHNYSKAISDAEMALKLGPLYGPAFGAWALAAVGLKNYDKALSYSQVAEGMAPDPTAFLACAKALQQKGRLRDALQQADLAVELNPLSAAGYSCRAEIYNSMGSSKEALRDMTQALSLAPDADRPELYLARARIYLAKPDLTRALQDCDAAVQLNPNSPAAIKLQETVRTKSKSDQAAQ